MTKSVRNCISFFSLAFIAAAVFAQVRPSPALSKSDLDAVQSRAKHEAGNWKSVVENRPPEALMREAHSMVQAGKAEVLSHIAGTSAPQQDLGKANTVVFISMSMPEATLKALLNQGSDREDIVFVLRGWQPLNDSAGASSMAGFQQIMDRLGRLVKNHERPPNIMVHPYAFETYKVEHVPVVLHKKKSGVWKRLVGEISIDGAIDEIERGRTSAVGPVWAVLEPNILDIIEERARRYDWAQALKKARHKAYNHLFDGIEVPYAEASTNTMFDPSVVIDKDYRNPDGKLIVARGSIVNPLDKMPFKSAVIAVDPYDPKQLELARQWVADNPTAIVFVTRNAMHTDGRPTWAVLGIQTYPLNEVAMKRFGIVAVPSLVKQFGRKLLVHTRAVK